MKKFLAPVGALAIAALVASCSSGGSGNASTSAPVAAGPASSSSASTPTLSTTPKPVLKTATEIATALKMKVPQITKVTTLTEENDVNNMIGRPGQYSSAAWITDSRGKAGETGVDGGAVVETFETAEDRDARAKYIKDVTKGIGMLAEYDYTTGTSLVRVSGKLTPSQVKAYKDAAASL
ncbi:hypothetical protein [Arthrobacter sp. RCC_34]|uniref:hypothetical protein n=1 Tax=Arthrobacter sp. RCC_34 TaxID=3239230 RepID=UPI0035232B4E